MLSSWSDDLHKMPETIAAQTYVALNWYVSFSGNISSFCPRLPDIKTSQKLAQWPYPKYQNSTFMNILD